MAWHRVCIFVYMKLAYHSSICRICSWFCRALRALPATVPRLCLRPACTGWCVKSCRGEVWKRPVGLQPFMHDVSRLVLHEGGPSERLRAYFELLRFRPWWLLCRWEFQKSAAPKIDPKSYGSCHKDLQCVETAICFRSETGVSLQIPESTTLSSARQSWCWWSLQPFSRKAWSPPNRTRSRSPQTKAPGSERSNVLNEPTQKSLGTLIRPNGA